MTVPPHCGGVLPHPRSPLEPTIGQVCPITLVDLLGAFPVSPDPTPTVQPRVRHRASGVAAS
jgi:hypothetical protein